MATTTNFGWETPDDTDLVKDGAGAMRTLGNSIDSSMGDLKGGTTGQVLSKNSNTDMDFIWVTDSDSNAIQKSLIDAKGDLIVGSAADTAARLGVGTDGQVLVADTASTNGVKWGTPASGSMTLLSTTNLSGTTSATVSSIDQSYKALKIIVSTISIPNGAYPYMRLLNGSSAQNIVWGGSSSVSSSLQYQFNSNYYPFNAVDMKANYNLNTFEFNVSDYTLSSVKPFRFHGSMYDSSNIQQAENMGGAVITTNVINGFYLSTNSGQTFSSGTIRIYGVN